MRKVYQRVLPENPSQDYYYIMRETPNTTALLIEYGFIDNTNDIYKLQNNLLDYVEAVVKAVSDYIGIDYVSPDGTTSNNNTYTVKKGDTLYSIANAYGLTVDELKELNNLSSNILSIGQTLIISSTDNSSNNSGNTTTSATSYTVVSGDNLYSIASKYNTTVSELVELNNLDSTVLYVGQTLLVPGSSTSDSVTYTTYTVKAGDTLYGIANSYGTSVDEIKTLNNLTSNILSIGQTLMVPASNTVTETNYQTYTVVSGDTLYKIANIYGVTVDEIKKLNGLTSNILSIGDVLQIPVASSTSTNFTYTVKKGDTLYGIATNFGITVTDIINLNNLTSTTLLVGQEILIPQSNY